MDRSKGALEVWIATAKPRLVGWMTNYAPFDHSQRSISIERELSPMRGREPDDFDWDAAAVERVTLKTTLRQQDIDHALVVAGGSRGPTEKNIPIGAKHQYHPDTNKDRYSWRVLMLDMDDYDWVFDLDTFEPFDRSPNVDEDGRETPDEYAPDRYMAPGRWPTPDWGKPVHSGKEPRDVRDILRDHLAAAPKLEVSGDWIADGSIAASELKVASLSKVTSTLGEFLEVDHREHALDALSYTAMVERERMVKSMATRMEASFTKSMLNGEFKSPYWKDLT